jgi:hypothetical protein
VQKFLRTLQTYILKCHLCTRNDIFQLACLNIIVLHASAARTATTFLFISVPPYNIEHSPPLTIAPVGCF